MPIPPSSASGTSTAPDPDQLLALALADPSGALVAARAVLAGTPDPRLASAAHQTIGVVFRHYGAIEESIAQLRWARRWAQVAGDTERVLDVTSSLGVALALAGRIRPALTALDDAVAGGSGRTRGRILIRRAHVFWLIGRYHQGLIDAREAVRLLRRDEALWQARAFNHRAMFHLALGEAGRADRDHARSEQLFLASGQHAEYAYVRMERGLAAHAQGDLPRALRMLHRAGELFARLDVVEPDLAINRSAVLLAAGLTREAVAVAEQALADLVENSGSAASAAALHRSAAQAALADGDPQAAARHAERALTHYRRSSHPRAAAEVRLVLLRAQLAGDDARKRPDLLRRAVGLARSVDGQDVELAGAAHLLAGQLALAQRRPRLAQNELRAAVPPRRAPTSAQVTGWLARATQRAAAHDGPGLVRACAAGLRVLDTHLSTLGATELRSAATAQGAALATLALRHAIDLGDPELVLTWSERWRAVVLAAPPVRPPSDPALAAELTALRATIRRLADSDNPSLRRDRRRLEERVRSRVLHQPGHGAIESRPASGRTVMAALRTHRFGPAPELVHLTVIDGTLYAVQVQDGAARLHRVGPVESARRELDHVLFALRREISGTGRRPMDAVGLGRRLQTALLGEVAEQLEGEDVVLAPPGSLHAVPWSLLPALRDRAVVVAPSATVWLRALAADPPATDRVVLVGGPRLGAAQIEIDALAGLYPAATVLTGSAATVQAVTAAMDGARLVHIAAHGTLRADSPLFSAIELADGPLTGYDLEQVQRTPHQVVLSACSSAVGSPAGADELLGVVGSLVAGGSTGVVASVVPVADVQAEPLMAAMHRRLLGGASLARALADARRDLDRDGWGRDTRRTAEAFVALGA